MHDKKLSFKNKDVELTEDYNALLQTLFQFIEGTLIHNDYNISLEVIADDVVGIGMGEQGAYFNKSELRQKFIASFKSEMSNLQKSIEYGNVDIRVFESKCASICAEIHLKVTIDNIISTSSFLQIASARKENGKWLWYMVAAMPLVVTEESIRAYPLSFADGILAHLKAEFKSEFQADTFNMMNDNFSSGILGTYIKADYPLYFANDVLISMLGYERKEFEEIFKDGTSKLNHKNDKEFIQEFTQSGIEGNGSFGSRARWIKKDGDTIWIEFRSHKTKDKFGNDILLSAIWDISNLLDKSYKDALTGIYNRRFLDERLVQVIKSLSRSGGTLSLLLIDIDFFKNYNDTYGHGMGDDCLRLVANTLSKCVLRDEDFVARYGGEEFIIVLPNTDESGAQVIAEKLLEKICECRKPHKASNVADYVTISIGGTTGKVKHSQSPQDYIKAADKAMYESKRNGRNRYTFVAYPDT
jgi:diguanylate cyclase (GGDEF)-like protein